MLVRPAALVGVLITLLGCSSARLGDSDRPSVVFPARFAEGEAEEADGGAPAADAGLPEGQRSRSKDPALKHGFLPDPEPLQLRDQWELVFRYRDGTVTLESVTPRRFERPISTARQMGRFAVELWIGRELIDRVRFDFPMLGAEPPPDEAQRPLNQPPTLAAGANVTRRVLVPASDRAVRAVLVDRATGKTTPLPWPPAPPVD